MRIKQSKINGAVVVNGSKNSALPIICATLLNEKQSELHRVPNITDIQRLIEIMVNLGCQCTFSENTLIVRPMLLDQPILHPNTKKFRASYYLMGVYLARFKKVKIPFPGGCSLGRRPIDFHLKGFEALGCTVQIEDDVVEIIAEELHPATIELPRKSLGATINLALLASRIEGETIIKNISVEPEVLDFLQFMKRLGVKIKRKKDELIIYGKDQQISKEITYEIIPDRIEAATFIMMGLLCGKVRVQNVNPTHLKNFIQPLIKAGANIIVLEDEIIAYQSRISGINIEVGDYPKFSTDLQPLLLPLLSMATSDSTIDETIYSNRFKVAEELNKMGANIVVKDHVAYITGNRILHGEEVTPGDLRAAASLLLAGLCAKGKTTCTDQSYLERGYGDIYKKLRQLKINFKIKDKK